MDRSPDLDQEKKNGIRLFQYLQELSLLDIKIRNNTKKLSADEDFFDIENPDFLPNIDKVFLKTRAETTSDEDVFLSIRRYDIEKIPNPPKELEGWIDLSTQSFIQPKLKKSCRITVKFHDDEERTNILNQIPSLNEIQNLNEIPKVLEGWITPDNKFGRKKYKIITEREEKIFLKDFPEIETLYEGWIESKWNVWRDKNSQYLLANTAYDKFYGLRSFLKTEIDNFDLLWSHDIFTWDKNETELHHPTLFTPLILEFDSENNIISFKKDHTKSIIFDIGFIREALNDSNTNLAEIDQLSETINSDPSFDVWDFELLHRHLGKLTRLISPDGISKYNDRSSDISIENNPTVYNYHGIYLLKKNGKSWAEYAKKIQQDIEDHDKLTPFLEDLVGTNDTQDTNENSVDQVIIENNNDYPSQNTELFFPLPYNEEQRIIAKQIDTTYGAVVQGPPGTGKTHTIANLISRFLAQGKTVLVTSQKGQALSVLKNKIPEEIRSLVVSQVEDNAKNGDLQLAVRAINTNLSDNTSFSPDKKKSKEKELKLKRAEIAKKNNDFLKKSLLDSQEEIIIGAERISPIEAAKFIFEFNNNPHIFKFEDDFDYSQEIKITQKDIDDYIQLLRNLDVSIWDYSKLAQIPDRESLPDISTIENFFTLNKELDSQDLTLLDQDLPTVSDLSILDNIKGYINNYSIQQQNADLFKKTVKRTINMATEDTVDKIISSLTLEQISNILDSLIKAKETLISFTEPWELEIFENVKSQSEYKKWFQIIKSLDSKVSEYRELDQISLGSTVAIDSTYSPDLIKALDIINKLSTQAEKNSGKIKTGLALIFLTEHKKFIESIHINNRAISSINDLNILKAYFSQIKIEHEINIIWEQGFKEMRNRKDFEKPFRIIDIEKFIETVYHIVTFREKNQDLSDTINQFDFISEFIISNINSLTEGISIFNSLKSCILLQDFEEIFVNIKNTFSYKNPHPLVNDLRTSIEKKDFDLTFKIKEKLISLNDRKKLCLDYLDIKDKVFSDRIQDLRENSNNHQKISDFLINLDSRHNIEEIFTFYKEIPRLIQEQEESTQLSRLEIKISELLPKTIENIKDKVRQNEALTVDFDNNVKWKKLTSWLDYLHKGDPISKISKDLYVLKNQEKDLVRDLIKIESWTHLKSRVSKSQKEALSAFALSMKQYGRGSGKYASTHMRNARKALEVGKSVVPVWIMPMNMIHELFPNPKAGMFDVVIFDEASQVDTRGLNIAYLGKKLLVVGDDEQVSPTSFTKQTVVTDLIARHMSDIPNSVHFSTTSSLFDITKIKMTDVVTLTEHFRCIEELIGFSNNLSYDGRLKVLRDQLPKDKLNPVLEPIFVENGFEETNGQVNKAEAERIVEELQNMLSDEKYKETTENGKVRPITFGVISLLGVQQAKEISALISQKISPKEIEEREIICGDPYTFQGDERDIILLSMVKGLNQDNPSENIRPLSVNKKENKQRINVAMSRARNKMFLFHSIPKDKLQNPDDLRKMIIDWFYNHKTEERKAGLQRIREEVERGRASEFEYEVADILIRKGYKVIPQWEVAGYRIDLVVQGENAKLAIECDGDKYHNSIEKWHEDNERQQILERAGWIFWRLTGSSFYRHREKALDSLWVKLDELGIQPS